MWKKNGIPRAFKYLPRLKKGSSMEKREIRVEKTGGQENIFIESCYAGGEHCGGGSSRFAIAKKGKN